MMDRRQRDALDRHITGNYGEDQFMFSGDEESTMTEVDLRCPVCLELTGETWGGTGVKVLVHDDIDPQALCSTCATTYDGDVVVFSMENFGVVVLSAADYKEIFNTQEILPLPVIGNDGSINKVPEAKRIYYRASIE